ncbi:adenylate/guanylate cyclase domain-containing protein [Alsobacter sp. SYSU BS001988]
MTRRTALLDVFRQRKALPSAFAVAAVLVAAALGYSSTFNGALGALSGPNALLYDVSAALLRVRRTQEAWPTTFILLIDQDTLDHAPWSTAPRALQHPHLAELGRRALDLGARKVAFDLVLALDPADLDIGGADLKSYDKPMRDLLAGEEGRVILGSYPTVRPAAAYRDLVGPAGIGVVDLQSEEDGVVRSIATRLRLPSGEIQAGFAELVAMRDDGELAIRDASRFLLFPRAPLRSAPLLTVARFEACRRTPDGPARLKEILGGRNVLVGTGIVGEDLRRGPDRFMTQGAPRLSPDPCRPGMLDVDFGDRNLVPGVLLQAAAVESAAAPDTPRLADASTRAAASAVMASLGLLLFFTLTRRVVRLPAERPAMFSTSIVAFAGVVGSIAGLALAFVGVEAAAIEALQLWLPLGHTLLFVSALGLLGTMTLAVQRDLALADLRISFGRYLPAKVVAAALQRDEIVEGEERAISVLFADLRSFIQFCNSRRDEPTAIMQALNRKFADVQKILDRYDACLDKFDGDAVIAFWNAVGEQPDHAARAIAAAIEIFETDAELADEAGDQLHFKVAVATGLAFVGNYGSKQKMNFSAIGEPMNMAARLEGLCNEYGVGIIIARDTLAEAQSTGTASPAVQAVMDKARFVRLGGARLKGFTEPVEIMTLQRAAKGGDL